MSSITRTPSTPQGSRSATPATHTPTGTWRHPRLDEINHRVQQSTFNERNVHRIIWNFLTFLSTFVLPRVVVIGIPSLIASLPPAFFYGTYAILVLRVVNVYNIFCACLPLIRKKDDLADIPLTPSQRQLLGLPPSNAPPTPGSLYVTPPRYTRSATPRSGSASGSPRASPLAGRGQIAARAGSNEPNSPLNAAARQSVSQYGLSNSPLIRRATDSTRRQSFDGSLSRSNILAMDSSAMSGLGSGPTSPTPLGMGGKVASVQLTNKWLYDRGGSPGKSLFT